MRPRAGRPRRRPAKARPPRPPGRAASPAPQAAREDRPAPAPPWGVKKGRQASPPGPPGPRPSSPAGQCRGSWATPFSCPPRAHGARGRKKRPTGKPAAGRAGRALAANPAGAAPRTPATPKVVGARGAGSVQRVGGGRLPAARPPGSPAGRTVRGILALGRAPYSRGCPAPLKARFRPALGEPKGAAETMGTW